MLSVSAVIADRVGLRRKVAQALEKEQPLLATLNI